MDYHRQRFQDHSLLVFKDEELVAICPAHRVDNELRSHWGLTYGGVIWKDHLDEDLISSTFEAIKKVLLKEGIRELKIKEIPSFYLDQRITELNATLFRYGKPFHEEKVFAIDFRQPLKIHKTKLKHYRKGQKMGFEIEQVFNFSRFWKEVLIPKLETKHGVRPVHSIEEITLLALQFPNDIKQYTISLNGELLAGITLFDKGKVVKSQYGAATDKGQEFRALEFLFLHLIYKYQQQGRAFFSMGTIGDENFPGGFNPGLKRQKEELGCKEFHQHFYTFEL